MDPNIGGVVVIRSILSLIRNIPKKSPTGHTHKAELLFKVERHCGWWRSCNYPGMQAVRDSRRRQILTADQYTREYLTLPTCVKSSQQKHGNQGSVTIVDVYVCKYLWVVG
jgi:hypothetical protein